MSDVHALSGAYAVDALDDLERAGFERHLAGCATCRAEVASLREATAAMADDVALAPPPELRAAVLEGIQRVRPLPPEAGTQTGTPAGPQTGTQAGTRTGTPTGTQTGTPADTPAGTPTGTEDEDEDEDEAGDETGTGNRTTGGHRRSDGGPVTRRKWFPALVAAVVLALVGVGATVWQPWRDDSSTTVTTADKVLQDPDAQRYTQEVPGGGTATIVRSAKEHRAVLVTEDVAAPPDGKAYQMWLQSPAEEMVDAGLVPPGSDTVLLEGDADAAIGAGLSLEPAGGSDQPTEVVALFEFGTA